MFKILLKAAVLVFIILSVYFIVHPSACSNLMLGRVTNPTDRHPAVEEMGDTHGELFTPAGDQPLDGYVPPQETASDAEKEELLHEQEPAPEEPADQEQAPQESAPAAQEEQPVKPAEQTAAAYSQEDIDYAIARRYVELEQEYARLNKIGKETAKEIAYKVMDDFEMTQQEWEAFLLRATESNLFNKIRLEVASGK